jgi:excinuclease UvrABC ATPase subunit
MVECGHCKGSGLVAAEALINGMLNDTFTRCKSCQGKGFVREVYMDEFWYGKLWSKESGFDMRSFNL